MFVSFMASSATVFEYICDACSLMSRVIIASVLLSILCLSWAWSIDSSSFIYTALLSDRLISNKSAAINKWMCSYCSSNYLAIKHMGYSVLSICYWKRTFNPVSVIICPMLPRKLMSMHNPPRRKTIFLILLVDGSASKMCCAFIQREWSNVKTCVTPYCNKV